MANQTNQYNFDSWAEFLTINMAENIRRCERSQEKLKKLHIELDPHDYKPTRFKAILDSDRVATHTNTSADAEDGYSSIQSFYNCPTALADQEASAKIGRDFIAAAQKQDSAFFDDAWLLTMDGCIPHLLTQFALRSMSKMMAEQLRFVGVDINDDFYVQFHVNDNTVSLSYDELVLALKRQMGFYLTNLKVKKMACEICFRHKENKVWFMSLP